MDIRQKLKPPQWATLAALGSGVLVHMFGFVNVLHNYDDIAQQPRGYGTGVTSGRWLLSLLGDCFNAIGGNYNLPFLNGLLFLLLIAASAGFVVSAFQIQNQTSAVLMGILFAVFPSAFSTLVFRYTAAYYGFSILLSVIAAWLPNRFTWGWLLSIVCIACSLGIYQAHIPITIGIFVLMLLQESLSGKADFRRLLRRSLLYCWILLLGLFLYYAFLNLTLDFYGTQLSDYQGVNKMGKFSLSDLPALIRKTLYSFYMLPIKDYCGLSSMKLIKVAYLLLGLLSGILLAYLLINQVKSPYVRLFSLLLCAMFPIAVNFITIMCPDSWIYTLMVYSFVLISYVPLILLNRLPEGSVRKLWKRTVKKGVSITLSVLAICYSYQVNVNYTALYYANRQVENYLTSMITQVRMADGFTPEMGWAFIGEIEDPLLNCYWKYEMTYGGIEFTEWMLNRYSWSEWIHNYYGYEIPIVSDEKLNVLTRSETVRGMPCWPANGSIQVIGDTVVIKCQEPESFFLGRYSPGIQQKTLGHIPFFDACKLCVC